jgi:hypothetical protein
MGAGGKQDGGDRRARLEARDWPARANGPHAQSLHADRRHPLRTRGACALGESRHAARRDRSAPRRQRPAAGLRAHGLRRHSRRRRRPRHDRGRAGGECFRSAPPQVRGRARPFPRLQRGVRPRRNLQVRRPRGEERHRLRPLQADRGLLGHACRDDRGDDQGAAPARDRANAVDPGSRTGSGARGHDLRHGVLLRRVGRRAPALRGCRAHRRG